MADDLARRLREPRRFLQVVAGARQVGKTTLVRQVLADWPGPSVYVSADEPSLRDAGWLRAQWERARLLEPTDTYSADSGHGAVLVIDEVQKVRGWSEAAKRLWDEDSQAGRALRVVLLGSAPLPMQQGLTESLAGRFEVLRVPHWSFDEMRSAFGFSLDDFLYFGGYPGAAALISEPERWRRYILDSLVETTIGRDVLLMTQVNKPALLRRLFDLGCHYSGQILSYTKMLGQLQDAGNTTTLAHYLELLAGAGMLRGLPKYSGQAARQRASSPKLQVFDTALMSAVTGFGPEAALADRAYWGRLTESAVGAHLANAAFEGACELYYWRERSREVDFVVRAPGALVAIEVKSGRAPAQPPGLAAFDRAHDATRLLQVGGDGIPLADFLSMPVSDWLRT
jgi:hypothetical protein